MRSVLSASASSSSVKSVSLWELTNTKLPPPEPDYWAKKPSFWPKKPSLFARSSVMRPTVPNGSAEQANFLAALDVALATGAPDGTVRETLEVPSSDAVCAAADAEERRIPTRKRIAGTRIRAPVESHPITLAANIKRPLPLPRTEVRPQES